MQVKEAGESQCCIVMMQIQTVNQKVNINASQRYLSYGHIITANTLLFILKALKIIVLAQ
jgi:hypothetical protein